MSGLNLENWMKEYIPCKNHIMKFDKNVYFRLIGLGRDESDYYYIGKEFDKETCWYSAVGRCKSLMKTMGEKSYSLLNDEFINLGCKEINNFRIECEFPEYKNMRTNYSEKEYNQMTKELEEEFLQYSKLLVVH